MFANALLSFIMYYCCNDRHVRDVGVKMVVQKFLNSCQSMVSEGVVSTHIGTHLYMCSLLLIF